MMSTRVSSTCNALGSLSPVLSEYLIFLILNYHEVPNILHCARPTRKYIAYQNLTVKNLIQIIIDVIKSPLVLLEVDSLPEVSGLAVLDRLVDFDSLLSLLALLIDPVLLDVLGLGVLPRTVLVAVNMERQRSGNKTC